MKPFIKWVGGKTQLLNEIQKLLPKQINTYIEPFLGGGAVLLKLAPNNAIINDTNTHLINTWVVIKKDLTRLNDLLLKMIDKHNLNGKKYYLEIRNKEYKSISLDAARFLYLNKTCFNGLYRENNKGLFNVPYNNKDYITKNTLLEFNNASEINHYLNNNNVLICNTDYKEIIKNAKEGDFIFVDPPYDKEEKKETFTKYNKKNLTEMIK